MVVRGLYLHDRGRELNRDTPAAAFRIPWFDTPGLISVLSRFPSWPIQTRGADAVWWNHYEQPGATDQDTLWQVCYLGQVLFLIGTGDFARKMDALEAEVIARRERERPVLIYTPQQRPRIKLPRLPEG
jgi:hypothetical protein